MEFPSVLEISLKTLLYLGTAIVALLVLFVARSTSASNIPIINSYPGDFWRKKAHAEYTHNAKGLIADGFAKFKGPFRIITALGSRVILPPELTEWVKNCPDLDHQVLVAEAYLSAYFEPESVITDPKRILIDVTRTKLSQNAQSIKVVNQHIAEILQEVWTDDGDWHSVDWANDAIRFVSRMSAAVFVGSELACNPEWQEINITYTVNLFMGIRALRACPGLLRPFVYWLLPEWRKCRDQLNRAREILGAVMAEREHAEKTARAQGLVEKKHEDAIAWMKEATGNSSLDPVAAQMAFTISALHTTSELLKQTVLDISMHPELVQPLRDEIQAAVLESGWTTAGLFKMQLLDSVLKETQRLKPGILVNLERSVLRDVTLPNGIKLRRGTHVSVDTSIMWSPDIYENPEVYDGFRFVKMRQAGGKTGSAAPFVSTSPEHFAFGLGKAICPGRFFVATELKVALANMLIKYEFRLQDGQKPRIMHYGFEMLADPTAKVEVRYRQA